MQPIIPTGFPEADAPWLPTLMDIEVRKERGLPGYDRIGFAQLVLPSDVPLITARWEELTVRFNERYAYRMIAQETLERWQHRLQNRLDEIVRPYERAYTLIRDNETAMKELHNGHVYTETNESERERNVHVSGNNESLHAETPYTSVNRSGRYGDSTDKGSHSETTGEDATDSHSRESTRRDTGLYLQENVFRAIDDWRDLDTAFVSEFENLFLNVWWY